MFKSILQDKAAFSFIDNHNILEQRANDDKKGSARDLQKCFGLPPSSGIQKSSNQNNGHYLDLESEGHILTCEELELTLKDSLSLLFQSLLSNMCRRQLLQANCIRSLLLSIEEFVKKKIQLKYEALADFFGGPTDIEQIIIFRTLLRKYCHKLKELPLPELDQIKTACLLALENTIRHRKEKTYHKGAQHDCLLPESEVKRFMAELVESIESTDSAIAIKMLYEVSLTLQLSFAPKSFGLSSGYLEDCSIRPYVPTDMISLKDVIAPGVNLNDRSLNA